MTTDAKNETPKPVGSGHLVSPSETPRTEAALKNVDVAFVGYDGLSSCPEAYVEPDFAREMERENAKLRASLAETLAQLEHVEELRRTDCGPIPATLTPYVIAIAKQVLANTVVSHGPREDGASLNPKT